METVVAFNNELSGLYESKPPISKAKMAAITRSAMKAIKFYKHVVQSVEKFILKCKPEYKVPGLYVIDSIVRQSRHQFGPEKDVFAPRFARNMKETFANLFRCAPEDKSRIIRVLNLWQKNNVFAPEVIQPIFDLADPNHPIYSMPPATAASSSGMTSSAAGDTSQANGLNTSGSSMDVSMGAPGASQAGDDKMAGSSGGLADLSNNNLKQLLNDPNVLRQLQTLQNFTKFKQDDKQHTLRLQEEAFEKHLQNVLKNSSAGPSNQESKEVEFVSEEMGIEVINLDGNDSRSPTPDRDRYKRRRSRSRSRSRSRDRGGRRGRRSRSRSRSRSPRSNRRRTSRERERSNRDKEKDREHERERRKKGLPDIKKEHLSVCSTTLWVGHLSKLVYQEELSDTFGEYGDIVSIDQIVPRGCAFIVMNRRQDAHKAMQCLKNHKLQGRAITISWAAGKGVKSKEWKDFWDLELGVTYIPWSKLDESTDFDALEEGGMFDEDTMPGWMKEKKQTLKNLQEKSKESAIAGINLPGATNMPPGNPPLLFNIDTTQPPPGPPPTGGPPPMMPMVPGQFSMAPPRMMGAPHMGMPISGLHMPPNIVPPHAAMMMMPGFGMAGQVPPGGGPPPMAPPHLPPMGAPHRHPAQFPPPIGSAPPATQMSTNVSSDDQMDIEMDEEDGAPSTETTAAPPASANALNFNQPPPSFIGGNANTHEDPATGGNSGVEIFGRERNRGGGGGAGNAGPPGSRWGGRGGVIGGNDDGNEGGGGVGGRWRENGSGGGPPQHNFGEGGGRNRQDFMNDFDNRGGPRGGPNFNGGGGGGDFHPNMQNRFNQPTNLMQMRIPPPNAFNQRGGHGGPGAHGGPGGHGPGGPGGHGPGGHGGPGGPPMFMRGQGGPGGPGGRPQGPGFFNRNNVFDRGGDMGGFGGRGGGRGGRGGGRGGRGGGMGGGRDRDGPNWSDEEEDNAFKRRGGGVGGNRFRDRDDNHDRHAMRGGRGGRGGPGGPGGNRDVERDRDRESRSKSRGLSQEKSRRISRDDKKMSKPPISDTEEDWDKELDDYDGKNDTKKTNEGNAFKADDRNNRNNAFKGGDRNDRNKPPFKGGDDRQNKNNAFKDDDRNERNKTDVDTPMKVQLGNKKHDVDEENWDNDDDYNRPMATTNEQTAPLKASSPQPTTLATDTQKQDDMNKDSGNGSQKISSFEDKKDREAPAAATPQNTATVAATPQNIATVASASAPTPVNEAPAKSEAAPMTEVAPKIEAPPKCEIPPKSEEPPKVDAAPKSEALAPPPTPVVETPAPTKAVEPQPAPALVSESTTPATESAPEPASATEA
ncbi:SR-related and CTD-associated factor 4 isoform X2 [Stomoxys calcitrans]|uniref:SR-related and CTD-associated factor 4 isoform X2 n=1 Tax=Stomoxys calcitrans TaxID=35570 RepID=UPI0027E295EF|nr:SR-related and CTD-associated factor 4 isoform X2 [Stomoxys calcitrans]